MSPTVQPAVSAAPSKPQPRPKKDLVKVQLCGQWIRVSKDSFAHEVVRSKANVKSEQCWVPQEHDFSVLEKAANGEHSETEPAPAPADGATAAAKSKAKEGEAKTAIAEEPTKPEKQADDKSAPAASAEATQKEGTEDATASTKVEESADKAEPMAVDDKDKPTPADAEPATTEEPKKEEPPVPFKPSPVSHSALEDLQRKVLTFCRNPDDEETLGFDAKESAILLKILQEHALLRKRTVLLENINDRLSAECRYANSSNRHLTLQNQSEANIRRTLEGRLKRLAEKTQYDGLNSDSESEGPGVLDNQDRSCAHCNTRDTSRWIPGHNQYGHGFVCNKCDHVFRHQGFYPTIDQIRGRAVQKVKKADNWVQCDDCSKWRPLPSNILPDNLPDKWVCSMNTWDPSSAYCSVPEEEDLTQAAVDQAAAAVKLPAKKKKKEKTVKASSNAPKGKEELPHVEGRQCAHCGTSQDTIWRAGKASYDNKLVCRNCGVYHDRHNQYPPKDVIKKRRRNGKPAQASNSSKKRRT